MQPSNMILADRQGAHCIQFGRLCNPGLQSHKVVTKAVDAAQKAKSQWGQMPWESRAVILLKAAELLAGKYRQTVNAATMLNMSKTPHQAEVDSACELIDFWRFNPHFMPGRKLYAEIILFKTIGLAATASRMH